MTFRALAALLVFSACGAPSASSPTDPQAFGARRTSSTEQRSSSDCPSGDERTCIERCDDGAPDACVTLGLMYERGDGVGVDLTKAFAAQSRACALDSRWGCHNEAFMLTSGVGGPRNRERARELYERGCARGHMPSCTGLGLAYERGHAVAPSGERAIELATQACLSANAESPADGEACNNLGVYFRDGRFVERNPQHAAELFARACNMPAPSERNARAGCHNYAVLQDLGRGMPADAMTAAATFARLCEEGFSLSCVSHAYNQARGANGIALDRERGLSTLRAACETDGNRWACDKATELAPPAAVFAPLR